MPKAEGREPDPLRLLPSRDRSLPAPITALVPVVLLLAGTGCTPGRQAAEFLMMDCRFQNKGLMHLHLSERQGSAHLLTRYSPGPADRHADSLRAAIESRGRLVAPGSSRHRIEIFLRNDSFGERASESVSLSIEADGRSRLEARQPGTASPRLIDDGVCSLTAPQG